MRQRIVTTDFSGMVRITQPTDEVYAFMTRGGGWFEYINHRLLGRGYVQYEIDKEVAHGRRKDLAIRYIRALDRGGLTDAEFFEIIRDRDCAPHGTAHELWDFYDIPKDRWFRSAWIRSHNGGPISIDLEKARPLQAAHIDRAIARSASPAKNTVMAALLPFAPPRKFDMRAIAHRIRNARDAHDLRSVWPEELKAASLS